MGDNKDVLPVETGSSKKGKETKANVKVNTYDKEYDFSIQSTTSGRQLFDQVAKILDIKEVWFFGLQFTDTKGVKTWLKLKKKVFSQDVGKKRPLYLHFRAKFYPEDVTKEVNDPAAQRQLYYQCRELVLTGEIYCPPDTAVLLASYIAQSNYGDYDPTIHTSGFLSEDNLLPQKVIDTYEWSHQQWEDRIISFYRDQKGISREVALFEYVKVTHDLEMFGVNYFDIKNKKGTSLLLGVDALGLNVYEKDNKLTPKLGFPWSEVASISFKDKKFTIIPADEMSPNFQFMVTKVRINKEILALCMGNHELYVRRRKDGMMENDPANRTSFVSNHLVESGMVGKLTPSPNQGRSNSARTVSEVTTTTLIPVLAPPVVIPPTPEPSPRPSPIPGEASPRVEKEQLPEKPESPVPSFRGSDISLPQTLDQAEHAMLMTSHESVRSSIAVEEDMGGRNSVSPEPHMMDVSPIKTPPASPISIHPPSLESPRDEVEPHRTEVNSNGDHVTEVDHEETDREYNAHLSVSEISEQLLQQKEQEYQARQPILEINEPQYKKLKSLFEELTGHEIDSSEEDRHHRKIRQDGLDKYKTLRGIQKGHTKHRVSIFEAL